VTGTKSMDSVVPSITWVNGARAGGAVESDFPSPFAGDAAGGGSLIGALTMRPQISASDTRQTTRSIMRATLPRQRGRRSTPVAQKDRQVRAIGRAIPIDVALPRRSPTRQKQREV